MSRHSLTQGVAIDPSVHLLEIPTPFEIGTVNAYLIDDDPLTLVDCGPSWVPSLRTLESAFRQRGRRLADVELLLLTHQHVDHLGLARTIVDVSDAKVATLDLLASAVESIESVLAEDDDAAATLLLAHGVPVDTVDVLVAVTGGHRRWAESVPVSHRVSDGGCLELGDRRLRFLHVPGHSPTDTLFVDEERGYAFGGDHLLPSISSNALVASRPPGAKRLQRYPALQTYLGSLARTRAIDLAAVLPGHGATIPHHADLIDIRLAQHAVRADRILDVVRGRPSSAFEIARCLWGRRAVAEPYLAVSEILGHLDLLVDRREVTEEIRDGVSLFTAS